MQQLTRTVFSSELLEQKPGYISILVEGDGAYDLFRNEAGGHRWQRIPPTERGGRYHTSTVTVAILSPSNLAQPLNENDVEFRCIIGTGPGGQHRQKNATCVVAKHKPTGLTVCIDTRSQHRNKQTALQVLAARLSELENYKLHQKENNIRQAQIGSGMRGDKIRTYRTQNDRVTDHRTGKKMILSKWMKGQW
jgi:peptide chain release factor 1